MDFNLVDLVLAALVVYALVRGYMLGALSQVTVFGGAGIGLVAAAYAGPALGRAFLDGPGAPMVFLVIGTLLVGVVLGQAIGVALGMRLRAAAARAGAGWADRAAGIFVGLAGMAVVVWLLAGALVNGPVPRLAQALQASQLIGVLDSALPNPPNLVGRMAQYLDDQGLPQVASGLSGGVVAEPVGPTSEAAVQAAAAAGQPGTVQIEGRGCNGVSFGSGFVTQPGFVVTNAHVIAGQTSLTVRDQAGDRSAVPIWFDDDLDLAVLRVPDVQATPLPWSAPADRGVEGATLGFPGGGRDMVTRPATVQARQEVTGRNIYGQGQVPREVLVLSAGVQRGDSGGPFVTSDGQVAGVVFAAAAAQPGTGYALTAGEVQDDVQQAINENSQRDTGRCRF